MSAAVVVLAYNRPRPLRRLLDSLLRAHYPPGEPVPLVLSIDDAGSAAAAETLAIARQLEWPFGRKTVIERLERLGVVGHFRAAGDLSRDYGDLVMLEDDLVVAPPFYDFATRVLDVYGGDERIAGCCLYGLWFNGFTREPFLPVADGSDVFFLRLPYTQGLCFSARQWAAFAGWSGTDTRGPRPGLHPAFERFGADEWFPALASYLAATGRFFCFPRVSLTVGWGDAGAHFDASTSWFQTPVQLAARRYELPRFDDALAVYDGFYELLADRLAMLAPAVAGRSFDIDLNATKRRMDLQTDEVLTTRPVRRAGLSFGLEAYPPELNVIWGVPGHEISLAHRADVYWDAWAGTEAERRLHAYHRRRQRPSRRRALRFAVGRLVQALRGWRH